MIDDSFSSDIDYLEKNQKEVESLMKKLKNPPKEYEDAYDSLKDYYNAYIKIVDCAVDPKGNLNTYTQIFNEADTDVYNAYKTASLYFED